MLTKQRIQTMLSLKLVAGAGGIRPHTICTPGLLELLLPLATQQLHLCAEGAKRLAVQLSLSSLAEAAAGSRDQSVSQSTSGQHMPSFHQALQQDGAPQLAPHGSVPASASLGDEQQQQQQQQQQSLPASAEADPSSRCSLVPLNGSAAQPRPLRRIRRSGESEAHASHKLPCAAAPSSPACQSEGTPHVPAPAPSEEQRASHAYPESAAHISPAGMPQSLPHRPGPGPVDGPQPVLEGHCRPPSISHRDPRLRAMLQAAAEASSGARPLSTDVLVDGMVDRAARRAVCPHRNPQPR